MNEYLDCEQDPFESLQADRFHKITCPRRDALVAFVPEGQESEPRFKEAFKQFGAERWYPEEGGHTVKCPCLTKTFDMSLFTIEKGGWDHEHCDMCSNTINAGQPCWVTETSHGYIICEDCYMKLKNRSKKSSGGFDGKQND